MEKIRNRYIQVPYMTQNTRWESDKNTRKHNTQESQEVSPFPAKDHKAARIRQDSITKINKKKGSTKEAPSWNGQQNKSLEGLYMLTVQTSPLVLMWIKTHRYLVCMKDW